MIYQPIVSAVFQYPSVSSSIIQYHKVSHSTLSIPQYPKVSHSIPHVSSQYPLAFCIILISKSDEYDLKFSSTSHSTNNLFQI